MVDLKEFVYLYNIACVEGKKGVEEKREFLGKT
jgi:hypothetical protein